jgi:quercetin dioxygenase-like cupin family protein
VEIIRNTSPSTIIPPAERFTGNVYMDMIATPNEGSPLQCGIVHFAPGARTAWHTHWDSQTLFVTEGVGFCQRRGGPIEVIRPGDRVVIEAMEDHWHGAAPNRFMVHIAMHAADQDGTTATWGEHVTDEEYAAAPDVND